MLLLPGLISLHKDKILLRDGGGGTGLYFNLVLAYFFLWPHIVCKVLVQG